MITALLSFFSGSVFRMVWGEISSFLTARQEHAQELDRMRLQADIDAAQHARNLESIKVQADLGVKEIAVKSEVDLDRLAAEGFNLAVEATSKQTGVKWVDAWNAAIRPGLASVCVLLITADAFKVITMTENTWALAGAALGVYVADRTLFKRGK